MAKFLNFMKVHVELIILVDFLKLNEAKMLKMEKTDKSQPFKSNQPAYEIRAKIVGKICCCCCCCEMNDGRC